MLFSLSIIKTRWCSNKEICCVERQTAHTHQGHRQQCGHLWCTKSNKSQRFRASWFWQRTQPAQSKSVHSKLVYGRFEDRRMWFFVLFGSIKIQRVFMPDSFHLDANYCPGYRRGCWLLLCMGVSWTGIAWTCRGWIRFKSMCAFFNLLHLLLDSKMVRIISWIGLFSAIRLIMEVFCCKHCSNTGNWRIHQAKKVSPETDTFQCRNIHQWFLGKKFLHTIELFIRSVCSFAFCCFCNTRSEIGGRTVCRLLVRDAAGENESSLLHETVPSWVTDIVIEKTIPKFVKIPFYLLPHPSMAKQDRMKKVNDIFLHEYSLSQC